jgi:hypothetical protein
MITDRISLNIALKYLEQFQSNEGQIIDILFSYRRNIDLVSVSGPTFGDLAILRTFINTYTPVIPIRDVDCVPLLLFEVKSFTVLKSDTNKNLVYTDGTSFLTKSSNINTISIDAFNQGYQSDMQEARDVFKTIILDEYIIEQLKYIECGYIAMYPPDSLINLQKIYDKYK